MRLILSHTEPLESYCSVCGNFLTLVATLSHYILNDTNAGLLLP